MPSVGTEHALHDAGEASPRISAGLSPSSSNCWQSPFAGKADVCSMQSRRLPEVSHSLSPVTLVSTLQCCLSIAPLAQAQA